MQKMRIEETNLEAMKAKKAACKLGYFHDNFIDFIVPETNKRDFIMHRGYWSRYEVFRACIRAFLASGGEQILSLGGGLDTLPFWTLEQTKSASVKFFECDLEAVTRQKIGIIRKNEKFQAKLKELCPDLQLLENRIVSHRYGLFPMDLNHPEELRDRLSAEGIDPKKPTLVICECVLVYVGAEAIPKLKKAIRDYFSEAVFNFFCGGQCGGSI